MGNSIPPTEQTGDPSVSLTMEEWNSMAQSVGEVLTPSLRMKSYWKEHRRIDGRASLVETRRTSIQRNVISKHAQGSAYVKLSNSREKNQEEDISQHGTHVLAAVNYMVGQPVSQMDAGDVVVQIEQGAGGHTMMYAGIQTWTQRILEQCIDLEKLSIVPGRAAFRVLVTVQVIHNDGNIVDAILLACVSALLDTKLPANTVWKNERLFLDESVLDPPTRRIEMKVLPTSLSMGIAKFHDDEQKMILDPCRDEEEALDSNLIVVVDANNPKVILSFEYSGIQSISKTSMAVAAHYASARGEEILDLYRT